MRKQYFTWSMGVFGIIGTVYGGYLLYYHSNHDGNFSIPAFLLLIFGIIALLLYVTLVISTIIFKKRQKTKEVILQPDTTKKTKTEKEEEKQENPTNCVKKPENKAKTENYSKYENDREFTRIQYVSTIYIKQVGFGPVLRIEGPRIVDMRSNTYYRIENNKVMQEGYGPVFEIVGNQIKNVFGGYLYELSGNNINKVFGGFYASISGNYITLFDSSIKFEMTDSLTTRQTLAVAALLFGSY